jgi:hypothetical protein
MKLRLISEIQYKYADTNNERNNTGTQYQVVSVNDTIHNRGNRVDPSRKASSAKKKRRANR